MRKALLAGAVALLLAAVPVSALLAYIPLEERIAKAELVVAGRLVETEPGAETAGDFRTDFGTIEVDEALHGDVARGAHVRARPAIERALRYAHPPRGLRLKADAPQLTAGKSVVRATIGIENVSRTAVAVARADLASELRMSETSGVIRFGSEIDLRITLGPLAGPERRISARDR